MRRDDLITDALLIAVLATCAALWTHAVWTAQDRSIDAAYAARENK